MNGSSRRPVRAWQRMLSGRRLDLLNPSPLDIEIDDIAHGLARVARWNGQTHGDHIFSVAQHCLLVEDLVATLSPDGDRRWRLAALLHDAPEYVVGDMISPFKTALGLNYGAFEDRLLSVIHMRFALPAPEAIPRKFTRLIKRADRAAAHLEAVSLAGFSADEGRRYFGRLGEEEKAFMARSPQLTPRPAPEIAAAYLRRFALLR